MDLSSRYLGLDLRNPLVASASPRASSVDGVSALAHGGVAAVVLPSMFEEELHHETARNAALLLAGTDSFAESLSYFPGIAGPEPNPHHYLSLVERAAAAVDVPVIASLNAVTAGGWTGTPARWRKLARPPSSSTSTTCPMMRLTSGRELEQRHVDVLAGVKAAVSIPVAVKLSPYYSSPGEMATRLDQAGADGLVLFNRFIQPDIDPETLTTPSGSGCPARPRDGCPGPGSPGWPRRVRALLAGSTGVRRPDDVAAYLLAGADVVMSTSSLLRHGPDHASAARRADGWMIGKGFTSLSDFRGLFAVSAGPAAAARERAGYVRSLRAADRGEGSWY